MALPPSLCLALFFAGGLRGSRALVEPTRDAESLLQRRLVEELPDAGRAEEEQEHDRRGGTTLDRHVRNQVNTVVKKVADAAARKTQAIAEEASQRTLSGLRSATRALKDSRLAGAGRSTKKSFLSRVYRQRMLGIRTWDDKVAKDRHDDAQRRKLLRARQEEQRRADAAAREEEPATEREQDQQHLRRLAQDVERAKEMARRAAWERAHTTSPPDEGGE
mmetsp:Transcript_2158/g.7207  ORF Transcript_2158/g.7207 Transcript_2158/m.7207 type:complete len:220 (+) Transcript_2158:69-728(+)